MRSLFIAQWPALTFNCLKAEDDDVCDGALAEQGPIVAHDLRKISPFDRSSTLLCNSVFGLCQQPAVQQLNFPLSSAPKNPKQWTSQGRQPFQVVHFSDVHVDREYTVCTLAEVFSSYSWPLKHSRVQKWTARNLSVAGIMQLNYQSNNQQGSSQAITVMPLQDWLRACFMLLLHRRTPSQSSRVMSSKVWCSRFHLAKWYWLFLLVGDIWLVNQTGVTAHLQQFNHEMQTLIGAPVFPVIGKYLFLQSIVCSFS